MFSTTFYIVVSGIVVLCVLVRISGKQLHQPARPKYLYERKEFLMTGAERAFFALLVSLIGERFWIFPQIHLDAIFNERVRGQGWRGAFRHINGKSVDFILCNKSDLRIALAIELDDSSHQRADRMVRDREVERIFEFVKLPYVRVKSFEASDAGLVRARIDEALKRLTI